MTSIPIDDVRWPDLIIVELTTLRAYRTCVDNFHDACVGAKNAGLFNQRLCLLAVDQYDALPALPQ